MNDSEPKKVHSRETVTSARSIDINPPTHESELDELCRLADPVERHDFGGRKPFDPGVHLSRAQFDELVQAVAKATAEEVLHQIRTTGVTVADERPGFARFVSTEVKVPHSGHAENRSTHIYKAVLEPEIEAK